LRVVPRYPALMLTLERMGAVSPSVYSAAAARAAVLSEISKDRAAAALAQCQGALGLLARFVQAGAIDSRQGEALAASLFQVPLDDKGFGSAVARWTRTALLPAVDRRDSADAAVYAALAGFRKSAEPRAAVRVEWEGERYELNLSRPEEQRLERLSAKMGSFTIDAALQIERVEESLRRREVTLEEVQAAGQTLTALANRLETGPEKEQLLRIVRDLSRITRPRDVRNAGRSADPLAELAGFVLGRALTALVYAANTADTPEGGLAAELQRRHDFGLDEKREANVCWSIPREVVLPGAPRHIRGSLLGLDLAFARQSLRRVDQSIRVAPVLVWTDRDTLAQSVALLNPHGLTDVDRDLLSAAIGRGRQRITSLDRNPESLRAVAEEIGLDGWRRQAVAWSAIHDQENVVSLFTLTDLMILGGESPSGFDRFGAANTPVSGCLCTRLTGSDRWRLLVGRPQTGALATTVTDLTLHVVVTLADLRLPAALTKLVAGAAMQDFLDQVKPNDPDDWLTLVRTARSSTRTRIEDFVSIATARGPLVPHAGGDGGSPR
jgi:hypothetical protein